MAGSAAAGGPRFTREAAEVRRRALVDAALAALAERGSAISVRDVARRAGVSPGLIRHHFGSFGALLAEAYRQAVSRVDDILDGAAQAAGEDPERRFLAFLAASFSPAIVDPDLLWAWLGLWGVVRRDPDAATAHAQTFAAYRARLERLLGDLARARARALDVRPSAIALSAMLDGLWLELCLDPASFTPQESVEMVRAWVDARVAAAPPRGPDRP
ncbi:MAG: TetR family transcriptional regulator [Phenylobacterium sp.]|nr:MAG: TetR family transcriptional regulator [Phenylobacterium sp.]